MKIHFLLQTAVWLLLAAPVGAQEGADGPKGTVAKQVQKLARFSGSVEFDEKAPGSPIVAIHLYNSGATDADLARMDLKALPRLRSLWINQTRITDNSLEQVGALVG